MLLLFDEVSEVSDFSLHGFKLGDLFLHIEIWEVWVLRTLN